MRSTYDADPSIIIGKVISVGQQATEFSEETEWVDGGETVAGRQRCDLRVMDGREGLGHHDQATVRLVCLCGNDGLELGTVAHRGCDRFQCEGPSGGFEGVQEIFGKWRGCRVEQERDPVDARRNLLEQLHPLSDHRVFHMDETGDVAARPRQARDEAAADRIDSGRENNRDDACLLQQNFLVRDRSPSPILFGLTLDRRLAGFPLSCSFHFINLLLQGFAQLVEQARILDGDDGLRCELTQ